MKCLSDYDNMFETQAWYFWWWSIVFVVWLTDKRCFSLISSQDHCQRSSPSWISNTLRAGFEPAQNLRSGFLEWTCPEVITTTPQCHKMYAKAVCKKPLSVALIPDHFKMQEMCPKPIHKMPQPGRCHCQAKASKNMTCENYCNDNELTA